MIAGTSMGAIIGGYYASKKDIKSMRPLAIAFGAQRIRYFSDFTMPHMNAIRPLATAFGLQKVRYFSDLTHPWTGIIKGHRIEQELKKIIRRGNGIFMTCIFHFPVLPLTSITGKK